MPIEHPRQFGDYELLEESARGGMGVVYKARQRSLDRLVAVKMIVAGRLADKEFVRRFRTEASAAAILQHPNIVAVHDVGVQDGQHFFSMDFVEGQNLSQLVGQRPLPAAKAARYVKLIAEAVHYAHERGILHRDLKPSNVLIDASDQPRITDFGLARRLESESSLTLTGQVLGSPNFIPPEQAGATHAKVGPPSDVYALGGILYYLLTARAPFQGETLEATLHQVLNTEPISPRLLNPAVPRDLETVCLKCLEKEPARRFQSAQALADELNRFLHDEPILARPIGRAAKTWRRCRRKPVLAGLAASTALLVLVVAIGLPIAAFRINRERQRAEQNAVKSQQVAQFLRDMLKSVGPSVALGRDTAMLREILDKTAERLSKDLQNQPEVAAELHETIGEVYDALGEYVKAEQQFRESLALRKTLFGSENPDVARSLSDVASMLERQGKYGEAERLQRDALAMLKKLLGNEHLDVARSLNNLAVVLSYQSRDAEAEPLYRDSLAMRKKLLGEEHPTVARSLNNLATTLAGQGKHAQAEALYREALALYNKLLGREHPDTVTALDNLGVALGRAAKHSEAEALFREALALRRKLLGNDHLDVALSLNHLGLVLMLQGQHDAAEPLLRDALTLGKKWHGSEHPQVMFSLDRLAEILNKQRKYAEAEALYQERLAIARKTFSNDAPKLEGCILDLAENFYRQDKFSEAERLFREVVTRVRSSINNDVRKVEGRFYSLADSQYREQNYATAEVFYHEALKSQLMRHPETNETVLITTASLARLLCDWAWMQHTNSLGADMRRRTSNSPSQTEQSLLTSAAATRSPLERARQAENLLRGCLAIRLSGTNANHWRNGDVRSRLGSAVLAVAVTDPGLSADARQSKLMEAETLLLKGNGQLQQSESAERRYKGDALDRLVRLYQAWDVTAPNTGRSAQAEQWKKALDTFTTEERIAAEQGLK